MDEKKIDLAKYRLQRAVEKLEIAKYSLENGLYISALSNTYYSIFHSTRALFALEEIDSKTHRGVIHLFNLHFIKPGLLPAKLNSILSGALEMRLDSDYEDFYLVTKEETQEQYENALYFMSEIVNFIKANYNVEI
ncbi:HEPN domain protein [bacterium BMS3Abin03]|nr:HEPN domain protein [bacterium BMS3Abin03]